MLEYLPMLNYFDRTYIFILLEAYLAILQMLVIYFQMLNHENNVYPQDHNQYNKTTKQQDINQYIPVSQHLLYIHYLH
jgi:hypothetical protein